MNRVATIFTAVLIVSHTACVHAGKPSQSQSRLSVSSQSEFMNLEPGTRITVVIPLLRSGGYVLPWMTVEGKGFGKTVPADDDFLGYEIAHYRVLARPEGGVRLRFDHADVRQGEKTHKTRTTKLPLFEAVTTERYVRIVFLVRESNSDHDMAVVAANDPVELDKITQA